jgi:AcrR family transcriptional regulator
MRSKSSLSRSPAPRGRPRSLRAKRAVLDAARALVVKGGYQAVTIEAVAARSGAAKTTIYRWWPNRTALVVDLLVQMAAAQVPAPVGRDPLRALRTELRRTAAVADAPVGRLMMSLLGEAQDDPKLRTALLAGLFHPRREASVRVIRQAQASGVLRPDVSPSLAADLLFGPLFYRMLFGHEPVTESFINHVFQYVLAGLQVHTTPRR